MSKKNYLDYIRLIKGPYYNTEWANGKTGYMYAPKDNCMCCFYEIVEYGEGLYRKQDSSYEPPVVAVGIVAYWLKYRREKSKDDLCESYYRMRLEPYQKMKDERPELWNTNIECKFLDVHLKEELDLAKRSETIYAYLSEDDAKSIKALVDYYFEFLRKKKLKINIVNYFDDFEFSDEEVQVLSFLSDGKEHYDEPDIDDYYEICESLSEDGLVNLGMTKDDGIKLTYKGKKLWRQYEKKLEGDICELECLILKVLSKHGKEIDPRIKPAKQIYDFEELNLYTEEEITKCSLLMQEKGWITCFVDGGPAYWHQLEDKGRIALRNYLKNHSEDNTSDKNLIDSLIPIFFGEEFKDKVIEYITNIRRIPSNVEKVEYTAKLVDSKVISNMSCQRPLWKILSCHGLYPLSEGNWSKQLNKFRQNRTNKE